MYLHNRIALHCQELKRDRNWTRSDLIPINAHHVTDSRSYTSLVPEFLLKNPGLLHERRLSVPDFVSQPWRKIGGKLGRISHVIRCQRRHSSTLASNPGFLFWILSHSFGEKSVFLQSCKTKSESLGLRLTLSTQACKNLGGGDLGRGAMSCVKST